jgi:hypothetical protein
MTLGEFAAKLKNEHLAAIKTGGKPVFQMFFARENETTF